MAIDLVDCPTCGGWGYVVYESDDEGIPLQYSDSCPDCGGTGIVEKVIEEE